jgi:hypothetical protein
VSSPVQSSAARPFFAGNKNSGAALRRTDEDICPYVVRDGNSGGVRVKYQPSQFLDRVCHQRSAAQSRNFLLQAIDFFFILPQVNFVSFLK